MFRPSIIFNLSIFCYKNSCPSRKYQEELVPISSHLVLVDQAINFQVFHSFIRYLLIICLVLSIVLGVRGIIVHKIHNIPASVEFPFWLAADQNQVKKIITNKIKSNERNKQTLIENKSWGEPTFDNVVRDFFKLKLKEVVRTSREKRCRTGSEGQ